MTPVTPPPGLNLDSRRDGLVVFVDAQGNVVQRAFASSYAGGVVAQVLPDQVYVGFSGSAYFYVMDRGAIPTQPVLGEYLDAAGNVIARAAMIAPTTSTLFLGTTDATWRMYDQAGASLPVYSGGPPVPPSQFSISYGTTINLPTGVKVNQWFPDGAPSTSQFGGPAPLIATSLADTIISVGANDIVTAQGGADLVLAGGGSDYVNGGAGDDIIFGSNAAALAGAGDDDFLFGGEGNDLLVGELGADVLWGNQGDDVLIGGTFVAGATGRFDDTMFGGAGNDILIGGRTSDGHFDGGAGDDVIYVGGFSSNVIVDGAGNDVVFLGPRDGFGSSDRILVDANALAAGGRLTVYDFGDLGADALVLPLFARGTETYTAFDGGTLLTVPGFGGSVWELVAMDVTVAKLRALVGFSEFVERFLPPYYITPDLFPGGIRYDNPMF
jgi:hypothetical protein